MSRRGFTLLETVLATVIGGLVVVSCVGLFTAVQRVDGAFATRARDVTAFATAQRTIRRALLSLVMMPASERPDPREVALAIENGEEPPSPDEWPLGRLILEPDPSPSIEAMVAAAAIDGVRLPAPGGATGANIGGPPQRVEVVLTQAPVPPGLALAGKSWARIAQIDASVGDAVGIAETGEALDPGIRGVFDLRPDGFRERIILGYGLVPAESMRERFSAEGFGLDTPRRLTEPAEGWTLWWRPVYAEERAARDAGLPFDIDARPELLVEAVPIASGLVQCRFTAFALDQDLGRGVRFEDYVAHASRDLPGYMEVEIRAASGQYANWMFEVGWQVADEGVSDDPVDEDGDGIPDDPEAAEALEGLQEGLGVGCDAGQGGARPQRQPAAPEGS